MIKAVPFPALSRQYDTHGETLPPLNKKRAPAQGSGDSEVALTTREIEALQEHRERQREQKLLPGDAYQDNARPMTPENLTCKKRQSASLMKLYGLPLLQCFEISKGLAESYPSPTTPIRTQKEPDTRLAVD